MCIVYTKKVTPFNSPPQYTNPSTHAQHVQSCLFFFFCGCVISLPISISLSLILMRGDRLNKKKVLESFFPSNLSMVGGDMFGREIHKYGDNDKKKNFEKGQRQIEVEEILEDKNMCISFLYYRGLIEVKEIPEQCSACNGKRALVCRPGQCVVPNKLG